MSRPIRALTFRPSCALCRTHALSRMLPPPRSSISRAFSSAHPLAAAHSFSATSSAGKRPLKLAIIGAGPSGFYTASRVLGSLSPDSEEGRGMEVHMYERLPTPYGLVRYGVAPDHPEVKNCQHKFDDLAKDPRFRYFGNVLVTSQPSTPTSSSCTPTTCSTSTLPPGGSSSTQPSTALSPYTYPQALRLPLSSLTPHYNALLLSYGASLSNPLSSVPGSSSSSSPLRNVHPALALVGWYNGHPAFTDLPIDLRGISDVSIVGQGNVALDVARILLKHVDQLRGTDVPEHVLQVLAESDVRRVSAAGRRGPGQVAFTTKEFREMGQLPNVGFRGIDPALQVQAEGMVKGDRMRTRLLALMAKLAGQKGEKEFVLDFLKSPKAFIDRGDGSVGEVEWVHNELVRSGDGEGAGWNARETEERGTMRTDMVVESVGYRSEPLGPVGGDVWALPFDERRGRVVNVGGRVVGESGEHIQGVYAAGWVSRGPIGVIASTMQDAYTVADQMLSDHFSTHASHPRSASSASTSTPMAAQPKSGTPKAVEEGLRNGEVVDLERWGRIDAAERENGKGRGKEREKYVRVDDMLAV